MTRFDGGDYEEAYPGQGELWHANLDRHIAGNAGQKVLRDLRDALLALPERKLISGRLADENGCVCTVGALALRRGKTVEELRALVEVDEGDGWIDRCIAEEETENVAVEIGLKRMMAVELAFRNDDGWYTETPEQRYARVLAWVESNLLASKEAGK